MLEHFKGYFGGLARSSSESWAESDLNKLLWHAAENAPLFIEAFYEGCEALRGDETIAVPDLGRMNRILAEHGVGYEIRPPALVAVGLQQPIPVPERYQSWMSRRRRLCSNPSRRLNGSSPTGIPARRCRKSSG